LRKLKTFLAAYVYGVLDKEPPNPEFQG